MFFVKMIFWNLLALLLTRVSADEAVDLVMSTGVQCIDSQHYCRADNWDSCVTSNAYLTNCCWSCHTLVELNEDDESCFERGMNDIMSGAECAYAAAQSSMTFIEVDSSSDLSASMPVGCSRVDSSEDVYQWNPAQRADDYDSGDDPLRICLQSRRPTSPSNLRKYVPEYGGIRLEMETYDYGDDEVRSLERAIICADIESSCQLVPDEETCSNIADNDDLKMSTSSDPYIPGGCFYYNDKVRWNSGSGIAFPPIVSTAYYSHICINCRSVDCPLPAWLWFVLIVLGLIVCISTVCCICFNFQTKTYRNPIRERTPQLKPVLPEIQTTDLGYNFNDLRYDHRVDYPGPTEGYLYRLSNRRDTPDVPMNLFNKAAY